MIEYLLRNYYYMLCYLDQNAHLDWFVILTILYPLIFFRCLSLPTSVHSRRAQIVARVRHALVWEIIHFSHLIKSEFQHKASNQMEQFLIWITMEMNRNPILQELDKLHKQELERVKMCQMQKVCWLKDHDTSYDNVHHQPVKAAMSANASWVFLSKYCWTEVSNLLPQLYPILSCNWGDSGWQVEMENEMGTGES